MLNKYIFNVSGSLNVTQEIYPKSSKYLDIGYCVIIREAKAC